ncbi:molybdopterin-binding protein [Streptomyces sp. NPDC056061]|uniref:molybdopterin-binding protein n=1 Tax=Streptomyces sp. NPDC056061 TaxID=3345700 RepID=UPI0035D8E20B
MTVPEGGFAPLPTGDGMTSPGTATAAGEGVPGRDGRLPDGKTRECPVSEEARAAEVDRALEQALALVRSQSPGEPRSTDEAPATDGPRAADSPDEAPATDGPRPADPPSSTGRFPSAGCFPSADQPLPADWYAFAGQDSTTGPSSSAGEEESARQPSSGPGSTTAQPDSAGACAPDTPFSFSNRGADRSDGRERHQRTVSWQEARAVAARAGRDVSGRTRRLPLDQALGHVLADPLVALTDLPPFDTSAMDGWVVTGPGPWTIREFAETEDAPRGSGEDRREDGDDSAADRADVGEVGARGILAGHHVPVRLPDGDAVRIATGARIPVDANAVIRSEHAHVDEAQGLLHARHHVYPGQDIRPRGQECRRGERLLSAGVVVTPAVLGLAAAAGYDELATVSRPRVDVLVLGDELLTSGLPHEGLIRDALGPMIGPWLSALGASVSAPQHLGDDAKALRRALVGSTADVVITTGGTASGPVDHVHSVLSVLGAELLVDGVAVRPGHPMLLARLGAEEAGGGRYVVGLPGNPLAAVSGLFTLAEPLLRGLAGHVPEQPCRSVVRDEVSGHPHDTRLIPAVHGTGEHVVPLRYSGPAMLRGIALADGLVVVPPGGVRSGTEVQIIELPWASATPWTEGCFT